MDDIKKLIDYGRHSSEVARTARAFQFFAQAFDDDVSRKALRVDVFGRGRENKIDFARESKLGIASYIARVSLKIFRRAELRRVDEDRDNHLIAQLARQRHQRHVAFVQRAHSRNKAYALPLAAQLARHRHHSWYAIDYLHISKG